MIVQIGLEIETRGFWRSGLNEIWPILKRFRELGNGKVVRKIERKRRWG